MTYLKKISFVPGLDLCERFFFELVEPLLNKHYPSLVYTACRLGPGSDVLGFDNEQSRDHDWGPKLDLLLDSEEYVEELNLFFDKELRGKTVANYSTQFQKFIENDSQTTLINVSNDEMNASHGIRIMAIQRFFLDYLNWSMGDGEPKLKDWLTFPIQHLLTIARGRIFHDSDRLRVKEIREKLSFYPDDIWLYLMSCCWLRIGQEEHLMGRAGQVGDELGSSLIASRLVRDIMRLIFLLEKQYFPYPKWFGTAFCQWTKYGIEFEPILLRVQNSTTWKQREIHLNEAYQRLASLYNQHLFLETAIKIKTTVSRFHGRPFDVIDGGVIAQAISSLIKNESIRHLPKIGSIDLFIDSTDALLPELRSKMQKIFE